LKDVNALTQIGSWSFKGAHRLEKVRGHGVKQNQCLKL